MPHFRVAVTRYDSMDKQRGENKYLVIAHQESKRIAKSLARVTHADAHHLSRASARIGSGIAAEERSKRTCISCHPAIRGLLCSSQEIYA